jgi:uncharacterized damage-inducible protein DinB
MQETGQQYTQRILGLLQENDPMKVLAGTPRKITTLFKGAARKSLTRRPGAERWSVAEIVAHLADTELVSGFRMRLILGKSGTPIQAFDQDTWSGYAEYARQDPMLSLEAFRVQRERNLRLLRLIPREMWEHFGVHEERGKETVTRVTEMMAGHDINHRAQIEAILRPGRAPRPKKAAALKRRGQHRG